jgi:hypothetical protein
MRRPFDLGRRERNAQQARSTVTFRTTPSTYGILDRTPVTGLFGRVYGTFMLTPPRGLNLEGTSPPDIRLPRLFRVC